LTSLAIAKMYEKVHCSLRFHQAGHVNPVLRYGYGIG
jgi:hypothetical protein